MSFIPLKQYWTAGNGPRSSTKYIVFHHAAASYAPGEAVRRIYNYHRQQWPDYRAAGYHVINQLDGDGAIRAYQVNPVDLLAAGVAYRNHETFHVCAATNFTGLPSDAWFEASAQALAEAQRLYPNAQIAGHKDIADPRSPTSCPGPRWAEWKPRLLARVREILNQPIGAIVGSASATADQAFKLIANRANGGYTSYDVRLIVNAYHSIASDVGVDATLAIAQMCHETNYLNSWWAQRPRRNPAGIGVTGATKAAKPVSGVWQWGGQSWLEGVAFGEWVTQSIPAHIGRLLAYALTDAQANAKQRKLIDYALGVRPLPSSFRGIAPTIIGLNGRWAVPGTTYGQRVTEIAKAIASVRG